MTWIDHIFLVIKVPKRILVQKAHFIVLQLLKYVLQPPVTGKIIQIPMVPCHGNACLLAGASPVPYIVSGAKALIFSHMVHIYLRCMPGQLFRHAVHVLPARAHEIQPEPEGGHQLRIIPGISSDIVFPLMAQRIIGMHDITVVEHAVPAALLDLPLVKVENLLHLTLQPPLRLRSALPGGQRPVAERPHFMIEFRRSHINGRIPHQLCEFLQLPVRRNHLVRKTYGAFIGAGDAVRSGALIVISLIADLIVASSGIMPKVHGGSIGAPKPKGALGKISFKPPKFQTRWIFFPKVPNRHSNTAVFGAKPSAPYAPVPVQGIDIAQVLS